MNNLKSVLAEYAPLREAHLGGKKKDLQRERLRKDLLAVSDRNKKYFLMGVGMLIVLFGLSLFLIWMWRERTDLITGVFAVTGISITGIITTMFSQYKEKTRTDMLLVLLSGTDDAEILKTDIGILADRL